jgi:hypothetical protein
MTCRPAAPGSQAQSRQAPPPARCSGNRQLIVRQDIGPLLRLGPARGDRHRDLGDAELPGGEHPSVARDQATVLAHQGRRRPAPFLDARGDGRDLGLRACACVSRVWDQPIDRPPLDLVGRPRSLISRLDSRAGARTCGGRACARCGANPRLTALAWRFAGCRMYGGSRPGRAQWPGACHRGRARPGDALR